ncbi:hypothetical protein B0H13DRAFT_1476341, partial [Mycena leptocephala]
PPEYSLNRMIIAPHNTDVFQVNEDVSGNMSGGLRVYYSADKIIQEAGRQRYW